MEFATWALMFQIFTDGVWQNNAVEMPTETRCETTAVVIQHKMVIEGATGHVWCERVKSMQPEDLVFYEFN